MGRLIVLMISAFIDMVGTLMIIPLLPFYATRFGATGLTVGLLVSSFTVAQLISAPLWGRFSDRYGRRPALIVGLAASAIAYMVFAFAGSFWLLFLSRIIQGAGGGTVSVIQAYVADTVAPEERAKGLGWLSAATNLGVTLGPLLGTLALRAGDHVPGIAAAILCVLNIAFARRYLVESRDLSTRPSLPARGRTRAAMIRVVTHSNEPAARLIWMYAIGIGAFQGTQAVLALFLAARFGVTQENFGFFLMYVGAISVLARACVLGWAVDRFGEVRLSAFGSVLLALGLGALPFTHPLGAQTQISTTLAAVVTPAAVSMLPFLPVLLVLGLMPLGTAFTFPCLTALLSRVVSNDERGLYMGAQQTFGGITRMIFPAFAGWAFDRFPGFPFVASAGYVLGTVFLGVGMDDRRRRQVAGFDPAARPGGPIRESAPDR